MNSAFQKYAYLYSCQELDEIETYLYSKNEASQLA